jgi:hypothetical protein
MNVVESAPGARLWSFFFPLKVSGDQARQPYSGRRLLLSIVFAFAFSALGWMAGGWLGSWAPRTACAVAAVALVLGWLNRQRSAAIAGAAGAAIVSLAAVWMGESFFSPVLAWPLGGLAIGVMGALAFHRPRARIAFIVAAPLLGSLGFLAGVLATMLVALWLNDSRVSGQIFLGGAAGFGFLLMAGAAIAARWLDATRRVGGQA